MTIARRPRQILFGNSVPSASSKLIVPHVSAIYSSVPVVYSRPRLRCPMTFLVSHWFPSRWFSVADKVVAKIAFGNADNSCLRSEIVRSFQGPAVPIVSAKAAKVSAALVLWRSWLVACCTSVVRRVGAKRALHDKTIYSKWSCLSSHGQNHANRLIELLRQRHWCGDIQL